MHNRKHPSKPALGKSQRGASLIELMIGITIGLLVVLAAVGTLVFTSVSSGASSDNVRLQQKAEIFFRMFRFHVEQTGAIALDTSTTNEVYFSTAYVGLAQTSSQPLLGTELTTPGEVSIHGRTDVGTTPDVLRVSYQHQGQERDCLGNLPPIAERNIRVSNVYSVNANLELVCAGNNPFTGAQALIDGVEDFQVTYGIKTYPFATPLTPGTYTYQFLRADQITDANWPLVSAVAICLQLRSDNTNHPQIAGVTQIGCGGTQVPADGRLHRVFSRTYSLRNVLL
jgi:type IV pilus assembly protein PilW